MEISHGHPTGVLGGCRDVEQATKAIRSTTLRQIEVAHLGEEAGGFQGDGFIAHGQSSNAETNLDSYSNPSLRRANVLQGGYDGNPEILDEMEAELDNLQ